ncbi:MAG TPA: chemotaxis protein CheB [Gemmatimonadaceae bacterium]|nr:chemotaxis protein CheB [Gemmatimonadaceae bacterium]
MAGHDIIVIGASAGGVEALRALVRFLPADLPAALFVVLHVPADAPSVLPRLLARAGPLPASHARDGEPIAHGHIYVAPPNCHMLVKRGRIALSSGPRENGHRPAVDPLFRSAAAAFGPRVVGVVLSGNLDDGTAGLQAIKRQGGTALVQDPEEAHYVGMPTSAIGNVAVDEVLPIQKLAAELVRLAAEPVPEDRPLVTEEMEEELDVVEIIEQPPGDDPPGRASGFTCPECHGALFELRDGVLVRYRCRVGHAFGIDALAAEQARYLETALWTALRALEESAEFARRMAERYERSGAEERAARYVARAQEVEARAELIRDLLRAGSIPVAEVEESEA